MVNLSGLTYLIAGMFVVIFSYIVGSQTEKIGFTFFILIGAGFILIGVIKVMIRWKKPKHVAHSKGFVQFCHGCGGAMEHFQEYCTKCGQKLFRGH
ncbi:hypothetical protein ACFLZX_03635 [Nanoarchaeota archaeon]